MIAQAHIAPSPHGSVLLSVSDDSDMARRCAAGEKPTSYGIGAVATGSPDHAELADLSRAGEPSSESLVGKHRDGWASQRSVGWRSMIEKKLVKRFFEKKDFKLDI